MQPDPRSVFMPIDEIVLWAKNPNIHPVSQVDQIEASIRQFGFVGAVIVADIASEDVREVRAGEGRIRALRQLWRKSPDFVPAGVPSAGLVPVIVHRFRTRGEADAYGIADEVIPEGAEFNDMLAAELLAQADGLDFESMGLDEIASMELEEVESSWHDNTTGPTREASVTLLLRCGVEAEIVERAIAKARDEQPMWTRGQAIVAVCQAYLRVPDEAG